MLHHQAIPQATLLWLRILSVILRFLVKYVGVALFSTSLCIASSYIKKIPTNGLNTYRLEVLNKDNPARQIIIGTTYHNDIYGMNLEGKVLWKKNTGGFCFDLAKGDMTGDEQEEVLAACGDDTAYCFNAKGQLLWSQNLKSGPIYSAAFYKSGKSGYAIFGTVFNQLFVLDVKGNIIANKKCKGAIRECLVGDFNGDGKDDLFIDRMIRDDDHNIDVLELPSLAPIPKLTGIPIPMGRSNHGMNATVLHDGNHDKVFHDKGFMSFFPKLSQSKFSNPQKITKSKENYATAYRARFIDAGDYLGTGSSEQAFVAFGDELFHYTAEGELIGYAKTKLSFNDVATVSVKGKDIVLLASAPNGDDQLYLLSLDNDRGWEEEMANLEWSGLIKGINAKYHSIQKQIMSWRGKPIGRPHLNKPILVQINGEQGEPEDWKTEASLQALVDKLKDEHDYYRRKFPYKRLRFASRINIYENISSSNNKKAEKLAKKETSQEMILSFCQKMEKAKVPFYSKAHGIQCSIDTYKKMMDIAPQCYLGVGIVEYGFPCSPLEKNEKGKQDLFIKDFILPLLDYAKSKNKHVWFHCKGATWPLRTHLPWFQETMLNEKYKDVIIMSNEDSNSRSPDINTAARVGAWYSGYVNHWGYRWVSDIPAFNRAWDWSRMNTGHSAFRGLLCAVSLGADYLNIAARQYDHVQKKEMPAMSTGIQQFLHLLGKGIIAPPSRENLKNIASISLNFEEDTPKDFINGSSGGHGFVINTKKKGKSLDDLYSFGIFSKLSAAWGMANTEKTDFAAYVYGRKFQAHNQIPNLSHGGGYCLIVPMNHHNRTDIDTSHFKTRLFSDGYNARMDNNKLTLEEASKEVLKVLKKAKSEPAKFPFLIEGNVFSSVNQMGKDHYLIYVIDPELMSPRSKAIPFTVKPSEASKNWLIKNRLTNKTYGSLAQKSNYRVFPGGFCIFEVYLAK